MCLIPDWAFGEAKAAGQGDKLDLRVDELAQAGITSLDDSHVLPPVSWMCHGRIAAAGCATADYAPTECTTS